jgi:hypothetical protein
MPGRHTRWLCSHAPDKRCNPAFAARGRRSFILNPPPSGWLRGPRARLRFTL